MNNTEFHINNKNNNSSDSNNDSINNDNNDKIYCVVLVRRNEELFKSLQSQFIRGQIAIDGGIERRE